MVREIVKEFGIKGSVPKLGAVSRPRQELGRDLQLLPGSGFKGFFCCRLIPKMPARCLKGLM